MRLFVGVLWEESGVVHDKSNRGSKALKYMDGEDLVVIHDGSLLLV